MNSTARRVPRSTGLPARISGSTTMRSGERHNLNLPWGSVIAEPPGFWERPLRGSQSAIRTGRNRRLAHFARINKTVWIWRTRLAFSSLTTWHRPSKWNPGGNRPPVHLPFLRARICLSRVRSEMISRSNCANEIAQRIPASRRMAWRNC